MAYDSAPFFNTPASVIAAARPTHPFELRSDFQRAERLAVLLGASALGALAGASVALAFGRLDLWVVVLAATPFLVLALHLTAVTLREGLQRDAFGCSIASILHVSALLAWPMTSLFIPLGSFNFFIAPALAMATLVLVASCWGGSPRAVYRTCARGALVAAVAAHQGMMVIMG